MLELKLGCSSLNSCNSQSPGYIMLYNKPKVASNNSNVYFVHESAICTGHNQDSLFLLHSTSAGPAEGWGLKSSEKLTRSSVLYVIKTGKPQAASSWSSWGSSGIPSNSRSPSMWSLPNTVDSGSLDSGLTRAQVTREKGKEQEETIVSHGLT